jgi:hypothetical protein
LDYAVEGAVSSEGTRVQISIRLINLGECARTIWSERFVVRRSRLSQWRELVATRIVTGMDPVTSFFDGRPKQRSRSGATGLLLVAIPMISSLERRKYEEAGRLINRALELEPDNAMAAAWAAFWQVVLRAGLDSEFGEGVGNRSNPRAQSDNFESKRRGDPVDLRSRQFVSMQGL